MVSERLLYVFLKFVTQVHILKMLKPSLLIDLRTFDAFIQVSQLSVVPFAELFELRFSLL